MEITRKVEIDVHVFEVACKCGESLAFTADTDRDGDIIVEVEPHVCEQEEE